jgi:guanylate kinase
MGGKPKPEAKSIRRPDSMIVVLSGASGSGKTTLARRLVEMVHGIEKSISFTTRAPRADETPGMAYNFVDPPAFDAMIARKAFVEWAEVHGNLYGTSADEIVRRLDLGTDVVCDIDVQGGAAVRKIFGRPRSVLIFVLPPSWKELERRLRTRGTDSEEVIERRLARAHDEHAKAHTYDFLVVNDDFSAASAAIADIVRGERLRTPRALPKLPPGLLPAARPAR